MMDRLTSITNTNYRKASFSYERRGIYLLIPNLILKFLYNTNIKLMMHRLTEQVSRTNTNYRKTSLRHTFIKL